MANASGSNVGSSSAEVVGGEESSLAEGSSTAHIPKVKLLDTVVDTFLQKLVSAGRCVGGSQVLQWTELWTWSQEDPSSTNPASNTSWLCDTSYERFAKCYKRFYKLQPEMTRLIYDQFITQLQTSIREEVSTIKEEGNLEAVLNSLDKIVEEAEDRKEPAWRPSGIPEDDVRSTLIPYFLQQQSSLKRLVQEQERENVKLAEMVLEGRKQVLELQQQIQARKQAWQALSKKQRELATVLEDPE
ncbi:polyamine-modulated factor 1 isoform X1 [Phascolarctos cinereus]|uniref:Polyamine-modulated factor 1-like isoform X2 n=1 Tax=Phascolarctos cinereus TaxID=38626 RepID=A0A6P5KTB5_PHACI|nr:polyamine-modulated factor 1-like isoform X2 [Phascolarctos cinereus]